MNVHSHVARREENDLAEILLSTAIIKIKGADGSHMREVIDQGSQFSLTSENAAQLLSIPRQKCRGVISGVRIKKSNCKGKNKYHLQVNERQLSL